MNSGQANQEQLDKQNAENGENENDRKASEEKLADGGSERNEIQQSGNEVDRMQAMEKQILELQNKLDALHYEVDYDRDHMVADVKSCMLAESRNPRKLASLPKYAEHDTPKHLRGQRILSKAQKTFTNSYRKTEGLPLPLRDTNGYAKDYDKNLATATEEVGRGWTYSARLPRRSVNYRKFRRRYKEKAKKSNRTTGIPWMGDKLGQVCNKADHDDGIPRNDIGNERNENCSTKEENSRERSLAQENEKNYDNSQGNSKDSGEDKCNAGRDSTSKSAYSTYKRTEERCYSNSRLGPTGVHDSRSKNGYGLVDTQYGRTQWKGLEKIDEGASCTDVDRRVRYSLGSCFAVGQRPRSKEQWILERKRNGLAYQPKGVNGNSLWNPIKCAEFERESGRRSDGQHLQPILRKTVRWKEDSAGRAGGEDIRRVQKKQYYNSTGVYSRFDEQNSRQVIEDDSTQFRLGDQGQRIQVHNRQMASNSSVRRFRIL